jgi:hypothetical protein
MVIEKIYPILQEHKNLIYSNFNSFYKIVINWCLDYYTKYQKAPNQHIQEIYNDNKHQLEKEDQELISNFLQHLSDKYQKENLNEKYVLDLSLKYLSKINLSILNTQIEALKKENKIDEAENLVLTYNKLSLETEIKQETKIFGDIEAAQKACDNESNNNENEKLFKLPGELGEKLGYIYREDFFSLNGVNKIGKSYYLRKIALICAGYGLNVIMFNLEMSHLKYRRIFYQDIAGEIKNKPEDFVIIKIPYFEKVGEKYNIKYEEFKKQGLTGRKIKGVLRKEKIKNKGEILLRSFPSNTLTFQKMSKCLDEYALQGFIADVVLIDYLDNQKEFSKNEHRHTINEKWTNARRLAQEKHIAVGTVSHTNKKTNTKNIVKGDSTEDIRKEAHVTHMLGLNQLPEDKAKQVMRVNIIHNRDGDSNEKEMFLSLECRAIGRVMIDSKSLSKVNYNIKREK